MRAMMAGPSRLAKEVIPARLGLPSSRRPRQPGGLGGAAGSCPTQHQARPFHQACCRPPLRTFVVVQSSDNRNQRLGKVFCYARPMRTSLVRTKEGHCVRYKALGTGTACAKLEDITHGECTGSDVIRISTAAGEAKDPISRSGGGEVLNYSLSLFRRRV